MFLSHSGNAILLCVVVEVMVVQKLMRLGNLASADRNLIMSFYRESAILDGAEQVS
jgi:hypothetical protein